MRTTTRLAAVLAALLMLTVACGSSSKKDDTSTGAGNSTATTAASGIDATALMADVDLISSGTLTVCSDMPYPPFEEQDASGTTTGFDYDLVSAMGEQLDVSVEFKDTDFDGILPAVAAKQCDLVASALTITDERKQNVAFTEPYFDADQSLLVRKDDAETIKSLDDLAGKTIAVQADTTGELYANEHKPDGATVKSFTGADELFLALTSNQVDAILQDFPVNKYREVKNGDAVVVAKFPTGEVYGFAAAKDNTALITALDAALAEVKANGTYDEVYTPYFGQPS